MRVRTAVSAFVGVVASVAFLPGQAQAVASGCTSARPTAIGGGIYGYPDNRSLNALIGVNLKDGAQKVYADGTVNPTAGYAYSEHVNRTLGADGTTATTGYERVWGDPAAVDEYLCVAANIDMVYIELSPKNENGVTDKLRYGEASHFKQPITPGITNTINLRLPLRDELGGNTGYVNGYITYNGRPVPDPLVPNDPNRISTVRVWPSTASSGPQCGVEGYAGFADNLGLSSNGIQTYYRVNALAGPRCGAATQDYVLYVYCTCGGVTTLKTHDFGVVDGAGDRIDFAF